MLNKIQNKPLWYKFWALSEAIAAVYVLFSFIKKSFQK